MTDQERVLKDEVFRVSDLSFIQDMPHVQDVIFAGARFGLFLTMSPNGRRRGDSRRVMKRFEKRFNMKFRNSTLVTIEEEEEYRKRLQEVRYLIDDLGR